MTNTTVDLTTVEFPDPEAVYEEEKVTVNAEDVRAGDVYGGKKVATSKIGTKWVYLRNVDGRLIDEVPVGDPVVVYRRSQTKESVNAQYRARNNRKVSKKLAARTDRLDRVRARLDKELDSHGFVDYSVLNDLFAAQADLKILHRLTGMSTHAKEGQDLVDVQKELAEYLTADLIKDFKNQALSRSTSVVSNLLEDCDREAAAKFIEDLRWS